MPWRETSHMPGNMHTPTGLVRQRLAMRKARRSRSRQELVAKSICEPVAQLYAGACQEALGLSGPASTVVLLALVRKRRHCRL